MKPRPPTVHVAKAASDPERGLYFWRHSGDAGVVQLSTVPTNLTPHYCERHEFAFDSSTCPACPDEPPGTRISGHESGVPLRHLECSECQALSDGFPESEVLSLDPSVFFAMQDGWQKRLRDGVFRYVCPACVTKQKNGKVSDTMAKKKNGAAETKETSAETNEDSADAKATNGERKSKMRQLEITVPLDADQIQVRRAKLVDLEIEIDKLKQKKREAGAKFQAQIKDKNEERSELLEQLVNGCKKLTAKVEDRPNERLAQFDVVRVDTGDIVDTRPMTAEERSLDIEEVIKAKQSDAPPKPRRGRKKQAWA